MNSEVIPILHIARDFAKEESRQLADRSASVPEDSSKARSIPTYLEYDKECSISALTFENVLLESVQCGNREALGILFRRYANVVKTIAYRILRNHSEADDLLQEVFLFIYRKTALFDSRKGSARSWIVQVVYHRAFDRRRQLISRHYYSGVELDAPAAAALKTEIAFYEQTLEGTLGKEMLAQIDEALSEDQRHTLQLYFFQGFTFEEIATEMHQSPGNVRHHYYRALEKMRKLIFSGTLASK